MKICKYAKKSAFYSDFLAYLLLAWQFKSQMTAIISLKTYSRT